MFRTEINVITGEITEILSFPNEIIIDLDQEKRAKISQCKTYLSNTDWQVIRLSDPTSGEALKEGVAEKRALARTLQVEIEACTTIEELNNINTNF